MAGQQIKSVSTCCCKLLPLQNAMAKRLQEAEGFALAKTIHTNKNVVLNDGKHEHVTRWPFLLLAVWKGHNQ